MLRGSVDIRAPQVPELSYLDLSSFFPWESVRDFNADPWRIGTGCVVSQVFQVSL